jgi:hypothetical protein
MLEARRFCRYHLGDTKIMSISNRHTVVPFISGETTAFTGQRLLKIGYKGRVQKDGTVKKAKFPSVAASVPQIDPAQIQEHLARLIPHISTMLEGVQDSIGRSLYESSFGLLGEIGDDDISVIACLAYMDAEANGSRLTPERVKDWFTAELQDNLFIWSAENFGFTDPNEAQTETVNQQVAAYSALFQSLNGRNLELQPKTIVKLRNALSLCADDSNEIAQKIAARLIALELPKPVVVVPKYEEML